MAGIQKIGFVGIGNMEGIWPALARGRLQLGCDDVRPDIVEAFVNEYDCSSENDPKALVQLLTQSSLCCPPVKSYVLSFLVRMVSMVWLTVWWTDRLSLI